MKITNDISLITRILGPGRKRLVPLVLLVLVGILIEMLGLNIFIFLIASQLGGATSGAGNMVFDVIPKINAAYPGLALIAFISVFVMRSILLIIINRKILSFAAAARIDVLSRLALSYTRQTYTEFNSRRPADYVRMLYETLGLYQSCLMLLIRFFSEALVAFILIAYFSIRYPTVSFMLLLGGFAIGLIYKTSTSRLLQRLGERTRSLSSEIFNTISNIVAGYRELKIYGKEKDFIRKLILISEEHNRSWVNASTVTTSSRYVLESLLLIIVTILIGVFWAGHVASITELLGIVILISLRLLPAVNLYVSFSTKMAYSRAPLTELVDDLIYADPQTSKELIDGVYGQKKSGKEVGSIIIDDVCFKYRDSRAFSLSHITVCFQKGFLYGIQGPSGAGKSTIVNLLTGFLIPDNGKIKFNDVNGDPISDNHARSATAYIPQEPLFIAGTLLQNVTLSDSIDETSFIKYRNSVLRAGLPEDLFVQLQDPNLSIMSLSGGQKQRIAIARALYFDRDILIFDEATSALDDSTKSELMITLTSLKKDKLIVLITHDLSMNRYFDSIYNI